MSRKGELGYWPDFNSGEIPNIGPPSKNKTVNWTGFNYDHILNGPMIDVVYEYEGELNHIRIPYDPKMSFGDLKDKIYRQTHRKADVLFKNKEIIQGHDLQLLQELKIQQNDKLCLDRDCGEVQFNWNAFNVRSRSNSGSSVDSRSSGDSRYSINSGYSTKSDASTTNLPVETTYTLGNSKKSVSINKKFSNNMTYNSKPQNLAIHPIKTKKKVKQVTISNQLQLKPVNPTPTIYSINIPKNTKKSNEEKQKKLQDLSKLEEYEREAQTKTESLATTSFSRYSYNYSVDYDSMIETKRRECRVLLGNIEKLGRSVDKLREDMTQFANVNINGRIEKLKQLINKDKTTLKEVDSNISNILEKKPHKNYVRTPKKAPNAPNAKNTLHTIETPVIFSNQTRANELNRKLQQNIKSRNRFLSLEPSLIYKQGVDHIVGKVKLAFKNIEKAHDNYRETMKKYIDAATQMTSYEAGINGDVINKDKLVEQQSNLKQQLHILTAQKRNGIGSGWFRGWTEANNARVKKLEKNIKIIDTKTIALAALIKEYDKMKKKKTETEEEYISMQEELDRCQLEIAKKIEDLQEEFKDISDKTNEYLKRQIITKEEASKKEEIEMKINESISRLQEIYANIEKFKEKYKVAKPKSMRGGTRKNRSHRKHCKQGTRRKIRRRTLRSN